MVKTYIPYVEVETADDLDKVADMVLAGPTALAIDGITKMILIDTRTYPVTGPEEPDTERVGRGSRVGFEAAAAAFFHLRGLVCIFNADILKIN